MLEALFKNADYKPVLLIPLSQQEDWPFDFFCDLLVGDLFSSAWETRHGAASGLREVIKLHGRGAGKSMDTPADQVKIYMSYSKQKYM